MGTDIDRAWTFPAGGVLVLDVDTVGEVTVKVICDLGFGIYNTLKATLSGFRLNDNKEHRTIGRDFIQSWAVARQEQGVLEVRTFRVIASNDWIVRLYQTDVAKWDESSIGYALVEQGLAKLTEVN